MTKLIDKKIISNCRNFFKKETGDIVEISIVKWIWYSNDDCQNKLITEYVVCSNYDSYHECLGCYSNFDDAQKRLISVIKEHKFIKTMERVMLPKVCDINNCEKELCKMEF